MNIIKYYNVYHLINKKMKTACKVICRILWVLICFILTNLVIWTIKYWWTKAYAQILNEKNWQECMSEFSILRPRTRVSIFYQDSQKDTEKQVENLLNDLDNETSQQVDDIFNEILSGDSKVSEEENINHNPYDPDYEDEFNSFFWNSSEDTPEVISVEEIENLEPAWFVVDDSTEY